MNNNKIDFIGDIHGYADKLRMLLYKLGYEDSQGHFRHPERKVVFIGDYIDRGSDNPGVVDIVRRMVDNHSAKALMGNHEYNAILFNMAGEKDFLRPHTIKNFKQHHTTMIQYHGKQDAYDDMIKWFKTLPLYLETDSFRAMHACWDPKSIAYLKNETRDGILNDKQLRQSADSNSRLFETVENVCKGLDVHLPNGGSFFDKERTERFEIRVKWWENPIDKTYEQMSVVAIDAGGKKFNMQMDYYDDKQVPVFFGHYWMGGIPSLVSSNVCCLDFSVAKDGYLVAYRWNGEKVLSNENLIFV